MTAPRSSPKVSRACRSADATADAELSDRSEMWMLLRRNSSSIASDGTQILAALGVLARGLLASPALLNAPAFTLGVATAW